MGETMSKGQMTKVAEDYVNTVCATFLAPHSEFVSIECCHKGTEECYMKVVDAADTVRFYNITDIPLEEVCKMVVQIVSGDHITREIVDREKRKEVASLFRKIT